MEISAGDCYLVTLNSEGIKQWGKLLHVVVGQNRHLADVQSGLSKQDFHYFDIVIPNRNVQCGIFRVYAAFSFGGAIEIQIGHSGNF